VPETYAKIMVLCCSRPIGNCAWMQWGALKVVLGKITRQHRFLAKFQPRTGYQHGEFAASGISLVSDAVLKFQLRNPHHD